MDRAILERVYMRRHTARRAGTKVAVTVIIKMYPVSWSPPGGGSALVIVPIIFFVLMGDQVWSRVYRWLEGCFGLGLGIMGLNKRMKDWKKGCNLLVIWNFIQPPIHYCSPQLHEGNSARVTLLPGVGMYITEIIMPFRSLECPNQDIPDRIYATEPT